MGDLSEFMPQGSETVERIYAAYKAKGDAEPQRGYLGASVIGHECDRFLWFTFRGAVREDVEGRMYRLWQTGHREEARLLDDLRAIGCTVFARGDDGEQFELLEFGGHFSGHMDAVAKGIPEAPKTAHNVECKTHKDSSFNELVKKGVRGSKPQHFAQMQVYMGGFGLDRALYLAHNKDTDELYSERVKFERSVYESLLGRAKRIIDAAQPPERCATRLDDWRCKRCPAQALCWASDEKAPAVPIPAKTCKTCVHATAETGKPGATWSCARYKTDVDPAVGAKCPTHLLLPGFVAFAEPVDSDGDMIEFKSRDGAIWRHGNGAGQWSTDQLLAGRGPLEKGAKPDPTSAPAGSVETRAGPSAATSASPYDPLAEDQLADEGVLCPCFALPAPHDWREHKGKHVATRCSPSSDPDGCGKAWCSRCGGTLFLCAVCGQAEAALEEACRGPPDPNRCSVCGDLEDVPHDRCDDFDEGRRVAQESLLAVDFLAPQEEGPHALLAAYAWEDTERLWDGPTEALKGALEQLGLAALLSKNTKPSRVQDDANVNAAEFKLPGGDYFVVAYKAHASAAVWKGKS